MIFPHTIQLYIFPSAYMCFVSIYISNFIFFTSHLTLLIFTSLIILWWSLFKHESTCIQFLCILMERNADQRIPLKWLVTIYSSFF